MPKTHCKKHAKRKTTNTRVPTKIIRVADSSVIEVNERATKKKMIGEMDRYEFLEHLADKASEVVRELVGVPKRKRRPKPAAPVAETGETNA